MNSKLKSLPVPASLLISCASVYALSWLLPNHHEPWVDFYSDFWAACVLLVLGALALWKAKGESLLPWHLMPCLALLCISVIWVQHALGLVEASGVAWISSLYLLGLATCMLMGAALERWKPGLCAEFLFISALVGGLGSLLIQIQQWLEINPGSMFWLFIPAPPQRFHANLGQPNQLATLLFLGVLACGWLYQRQRLPGLVAWILSVALAVGLALAESRTTWLVVSFSLIVMILFSGRLGISGKMKIGITFWVICFLFFIFALPEVNILLGKNNYVYSLRGISSGELRFKVWGSLLEAAWSRPWFGYGWMQTSFAQFGVDPYAIVAEGTHRHAHNIFIDILIFLGMPLGLVICLALGAWVVKAFARIKSFENLWAMLFLAAIGIHALLEYPLYYAYFLLPFGLMVGSLNEAMQFRILLKTKYWPMILCMLVVASGLIITAADYFRVEEDFFALRFERQQMKAPSDRLAPDVMVLDQLQDQIWLIRVDPEKAYSEQDIGRALRTAKLLPSTITIYKLAAMYALAGKTGDAEYWVVVLTRLNQPSKGLVAELHRQWNEQAELQPRMAEVRWPAEDSRSTGR